MSLLRFCNALIPVVMPLQWPLCYPLASAATTIGKSTGWVAMERLATTPRSGNLKVLVAEEDPRFRRIVRLNLEREGLQAVEAASVAECQIRLREGGVGVVIISSKLPGFDAQQFSRWLRFEFPHKAVPVVILSFEPEDRLLTRPLRLADFRRKPFDPGELVSQVANLMQTA